MQVTLYTKPDCGLCSDVKRDLLTLKPEFDFTLVEQNIELDPELAQRFRYLVPVVEIAGGELLYPPHTGHQLYNALHVATQPGSRS